jgi:predicted AAA+ superfamily ATPase
VFNRILNLNNILQRKSLFLLGPRQTGKSTFLRKTIPNAIYIDLLESETYRTLVTNPEKLRQMVSGQVDKIVIDEIQKIPALLNEVQLLIDRDKNLRFVLTGSSARKLFRSGVNLLGGRASKINFSSLVYPEVGPELTKRRLSLGGLPRVLTLPDDDAVKELKDYIGLYLQEEIRAEALTRSIEAFSRFLQVAGHCNAEQINFTKVGADSQVPSRTVHEYFSILEDTLIGHLVKPFSKTTRKTVSRSKFYFFDIGVQHAINGVKQIGENSLLLGKSLEQLTFLELKAYTQYNELDLPICYWRTTSQLEVDFIIGDDVAIEVKSTSNITDRDLKGMRALSDEINFKKKIIIANEPHVRVTDDKIQILPVDIFLARLWAGEIL